MKELPEVVIKDASKSVKIGIFRSVRRIFSNFFVHKDLIWQLFKRDFLASYKKNFLGISWLFINPLVGMISWLLLNQSGVLNVQAVEGNSYPAFLLVGLSLWSLFQGAYLSSAQTLQAGAGFAMQVNYPKEILFFKQLGQHLAGYAPSMVASIVILIFIGFRPNIAWLIYPVLSLPLLILGCGVGIFLSPIFVLIPDLKGAVDTFVGILFFISPVAFNRPSEGLLARLFELNPLAPLIETPRKALVTGEVVISSEFLVITLGVLILFLLAVQSFYAMETWVTEKIG